MTLPYREKLIFSLGGAHHGLLVDVPVPKFVSESLTVPGGETPNDMHVTLCYVGAAEMLGLDELKELRDAVQKVVARAEPFTFVLTGVDRFPASESSDWKDVIIAKVSSKPLLALRAKIYAALKAAGAEPNHDFTYTPHITLRYLAPGVPDETPVIPSDEIPVTEVRIKKDGGTVSMPLGSQVRAEAMALDRLNKLSTTSVGGGSPAVRTLDVFTKPCNEIMLALNRKTTENEVETVVLAEVEPRQEWIPVQGLARYIVKPRRDPPDVARLESKDGKIRWVLQEGHTRMAAALLRGEKALAMRVWRFEQNARGEYVPVARGMHRRGQNLSETLTPAEIRLVMLQLDWQVHKEGLVKRFSFPNRRMCAAFLLEVLEHANRANHHPDVDVHECDVTLTFVTHQEDDTITHKDVDSAAVVDQIASTLQTMLSNDQFDLDWAKWNEERKAENAGRVAVEKASESAKGETKGEGVLPAGVQARLQEIGHTKEEIDKLDFEKAQQIIDKSERRGKPTPEQAADPAVAGMTQTERNEYARKQAESEYERMGRPMRRVSDIKIKNVGRKKDLSYREKLAALVNCPDISDVSFPTMIGAIDPNKKKRKRKKVNYHGVTLGRAPMKFEAMVLSLSEIPVRLDLAVNAIIEHGTDVLLETMQNIAAYGAAEVHRELVRQGAPLSLLDRKLDLDVTALYDRESDSWDYELAETKAAAERRLNKKRLSATRRGLLLKELVEFHEPGIRKRHANRAVNEAFAFGRSEAINACRRQIDGPISLADDEIVTVDAVIQTAVMDTNTCDECEAVDGEQMEFGDARQEELHPPYVLCLGGDRCRCVQIALLSDGSEVEVDELPDDIEAT